MQQSQNRGYAPQPSIHHPIRLRVSIGLDGEAAVIRAVARLHARGLAAHINGQLVPGRPEVDLVIIPIEPDTEVWGPLQNHERVIRPAPDYTHPHAQQALRHAVKRARQLGHEAITLGEWIHSRRCPARHDNDQRRCRCEPRAVTRTMALSTAEQLVKLGGRP